MIPSPGRTVLKQNVHNNHQQSSLWFSNFLVNPHIEPTGFFKAPPPATALTKIFRNDIFQMY